MLWFSRFKKVNGEISSKLKGAPKEKLHLEIINFQLVKQGFSFELVFYKGFKRTGLIRKCYFISGGSVQYI